MINPVDTFLIFLSHKYGVDQFILRYSLCLLGSFSFNTILKRLPDDRVNLKCLYIISVSAFYLFGLLNLYEGFRTLLISTMFTYTVTRFYKSKFMPYVNFAFVMGHLALNHIFAQFLSPTTAVTDSIDITGSQMVLVMKLTSFGWSYYDGANATKEEFDSLTQYQKDRAITSHPSLLKFLAFAFFYPSLLTGPSFDFADFDSWLNCELFHDLPESKKPKSRLQPEKRRQIPKNGKLAFWKVLQGLTWMILSVVGPMYIPINYINDKQAFLNHSFLYRIHYMYLVGLVFRFKYYAAWTISEASCISCGLGYNGYDQKTQQIKWNRVQNIDIPGVEFAQNTHDCLEAWNMNTNKWLKNSVYLRVSKRGKKPGFRSTLFTFLTSAFWHGTRPGYYLTFATGAFYQTCGKFYRRNFRPMFLKEDGVTPGPFKWAYDFIGSYVIKLAFGYLAQPFIILDFRKSLEAWGTVYYYVHIGVAVTFFLFKGPYSKSVVKFCKSKQPKEIVLMDQKKLEKTISESSGSLAEILKQKAEFEEEEQARSEDINLGVAEIDLSEWSNVKDEWGEFVKDYSEWRDNNGLEVEEENLKRAFGKFVDEFSEVSKKGIPRERKMSFSAFSPIPFSKKK
ncbi:hypothetical protein Kpol_1042p12 [Vanderwaltozyma polyspora DSM 70294]|uniref:Lysophospholipid acyltransferase n=1 Tax=Vanderwaltozyma polyspora (strain ATCC 22028 / DSM 70294 / BCRC 21397 / CBS 2163 / NBRC 10782 / NRRL Y-8283 / UCD 57-17) TaxID=436907 RepID=A7TQ99_VANPO|nr:uncharacterized protein Kpol_1042p12 [Vanderwaltozyma polyspora DSM 70294]EDO15553.1 hypothetical protein Kpol_1042p12 [Vanderwaltozyma polyspora DSM 70294]